MNWWHIAAAGCRYRTCVHFSGSLAAVTTSGSRQNLANAKSKTKGLKQFSKQSSRNTAGHMEPGDFGNGFEPAAGVDGDAAELGIEGRGVGDAGFAAAGEADAFGVLEEG